MMSLRRPDPVSVVVTCRGEVHRLDCRDADLRALDHDDIDGELTLAALGGEAAECAELVDAWRRARTDLRVLVLASRGATDQLAELPVEPAQPAPFRSRRVGRVARAARPMPARYGWASASVSFASTGVQYLMPGVPGVPGGGAAPDFRPDPLVRLLTLDRALSHRLVAAVILAWAERLERGEVAADLPALRVALIGRAQAALAEWATRPAAPIDVTMLPAGSPATVTNGARLEIGLPFSWLADVWAPGLSQLLGRFTLGAVERDGAIHLDTLDGAVSRAGLVVAPD